MPRIKLEGAEELVTALKTRADKASVKAVVKQCGSEMQRMAQRKAPVGTPESTGIKGYRGGTLRRSIGLTLKDGGMTAEVEAGADYAPYVEYGTRYMKARPYLRPAYEKESEVFKADLNKLVR